VVDTIDLYDYREEDIFAMTDEEKNIDTKHWPSKDNIVSFYPSHSGAPHPFTF